MDDTDEIHKHIHLQLGFAEFDAVVRKRNLKELVLADKDDVVAPDRTEFLRGVRWFGGITGGMKAIQKLSVRITAVIRMVSTYSHL